MWVVAVPRLPFKRVALSLSLLCPCLNFCSSFFFVSCLSRKNVKLFSKQNQNFFLKCSFRKSGTTLLLLVAFGFSSRLQRRETFLLKTFLSKEKQISIELFLYQLLPIQARVTFLIQKASLQAGRTSLPQLCSRPCHCIPGRKSGHTPSLESLMAEHSSDAR